jgi:hypothetical protein
MPPAFGSAEFRSGTRGYLPHSTLRESNNESHGQELYVDGQYTGQSLSSGEGLDSLGWYLGAQQSLTGGAANFFHQPGLTQGCPLVSQTAIRGVVSCFLLARA